MPACDAIAIALRTNSPIWVMEEVLADASILLTEMLTKQNSEPFRFLANLRPEDLIQGGGFALGSLEIVMG